MSVNVSEKEKKTRIFRVLSRLYLTSQNQKIEPFGSFAV